MLELGQRCISSADRIRWLRLINSKKPPPRVMTVAIILAGHCNYKTGQCNPSRKSVSEEAGLDPSNVTRALRWLQDSGSIKEGVSTTRAKQWDLLYFCERCHQCTSKGVTSAHQRVSPVHTRTGESEQVKEKTPLGPPKGGAESDFSNHMKETKKGRRRRRHNPNRLQELIEDAARELCEEHDAEAEGDAAADAIGLEISSGPHVGCEGD